MSCRDKTPSQRRHHDNAHPSVTRTRKLVASKSSNCGGPPPRLRGGEVFPDLVENISLSENNRSQTVPPASSRKGFRLQETKPENKAPQARGPQNLPLSETSADNFQQNTNHQTGTAIWQPGPLRVKNTHHPQATRQITDASYRKVVLVE